MKPRIIGMLLAGFAVALGYASIYVPLREAAAHTAKVSHIEQAPVVAVAAFIFGMVYVVLGDDAKALLGDRRNRTPMGWAVIIGSVGAGFAVYFLLQLGLQSYGYAGA